MKHHFLLLFFAIQLWGVHLFAQEKTKLNVIYGFEYARDSENKDDPYMADMILSLGKHSSRYSPLLMYKEHDPKKLEKHKKLQNAPTANMTVVTGIPGLRVNNQGVLIQEEIIKKMRNDQMFVNGHFGLKIYTVETQIPHIKWEIKSDKKTIGGFNSQKAVGDYGGRTYVVWFTSELPFRDGPWKLSGLPGLILEARDTNNEIRFTFKEITRNTDPKNTTASFLSSQFNIPASLKLYNEIKAEFEKNPVSVMSAQAPNTEIYILNIEDPDSHTVKAIGEYNPMELSFPTTD